MSDTSTVINNVLDKFGNGADRLATDAEKFASEFVKRVDSIAPQIAANIKELSLYAWKVLVRQQIAEGIFYTIAAIMIPALTYMYFKLFLSRFKNSYGEFEDPLDGGLYVCTIFLLIGAIIGTSCFLFYGITHLISPEYYAVEELIEKIVAVKGNN